MQTLFYVYSLSYYMLVRRAQQDRIYAFFGILFLIINVLIVLGGVYGFMVKGSIDCGEHGVTYMSYSLIQGVVGIVFSLIFLIVTIYFYISYKKNKTIPYFSTLSKPVKSN